HNPPTEPLLDTVNDVRKVQGRTSITPNQWNGMSPDVRKPEIEKLLNFWNISLDEGQVPGELIQAQNWLKSYSASPGAKSELVKQLQGQVDTLKKIDAVQKLNAQAKAARASAEKNAGREEGRNDRS